MPEAIHIDGRQGEGGGQILRTSLALAALLQQPVKIDSIRANRAQPGLKTQHLAGVLALARITDAEVIGAHKHSTRLEFAPRAIKGGKYRFEIVTAGAASMLFGAVLPALLFARQPSEVTITGGTHVPFSPPFHYLDKVFLPVVRKLGGDIDLELVRWGFYPKGGGEIRVHVKPCNGLHGVQLANRGELRSLQFSACSSVHLPGHIAQREIAHAEMCLAEQKNKLRVRALKSQSFSPGNFVFLEAYYEHTGAGFSALGKRGKPAEEVADEACRAFRAFDMTIATVDSHLADQIILYASLAHGASFFITEKVTSHLVTNIAVIRKFLPVNIELDNTTGQVSVKGTGQKAPK
jgi:RNA 3'-terminal phosphate cyclase (ATP)